MTITHKKITAIVNLGAGFLYAGGGLLGYIKVRNDKLIVIIEY